LTGVQFSRIRDYIWNYNACGPSAERDPLRHFLQIVVVTGHDLWNGMITLPMLEASVLMWVESNR